MPRLVGRRSSSGWYGGLVLLVILATAAYTEYVGIVNLVPKFGRDRAEYSVLKSSTDMPQASPLISL